MNYTATNKYNSEQYNVSFDIKSGNFIFDNDIVLYYYGQEDLTSKPPVYGAENRESDFTNDPGQIWISKESDAKIVLSWSEPEEINKVLLLQKVIQDIKCVNRKIKDLQKDHQELKKKLSTVLNEFLYKNKKEPVL
jgi:hypothetical protein